MSTEPAPTVDGRRLRSERTRQLIIEAYLSLVRASQQVPTSAQIAERAGYSVRSVFERFPDMMSLRIAAADFAFAQGTAGARLRDLDGDRATRIRSQVETRARTCEAWLPMWRAINSDQSDSDELKSRVRYAREMIFRRLELMYRPELTTLDERRRRYVMIALEALTDFESWARMRENYGLSIEDACEVWIKMIDRLLPATPTA
jgi:AcrR family transcriptional regulator